MEQSAVTRILTEGLAHQAAGRADAAEALYRGVLAHDPAQPDALHLLGMLINAKGRPAEGAELVERAIEAKPHVAAFHNNLGTIYAMQGRAGEAEDAFRRAIERDAGYAEAHRNLGLSLRGQSRVTEASEALTAATCIRPDYGEAWANLAAVLRDLGRMSDGADAERKALLLQGGPLPAYLALGMTLREQRRLEEAADVLRQGVRRSPDDALLHFNLALILLEAGHYRAGFTEYEWRWRLPEFQARRVDFGRPGWDGSDLQGRTILLHAEQGLGTNVQFVRYAPLVAARGGKVVMLCPPGLAPLFRTVEGVTAVVDGGQPPPPFDMHAPMASLPRLLGTTFESIPSRVPYVAAEPARVAAWRKRLAADGPVAAGMKVGLVWAGNQKPDPARTCPLSAFAPLAGVAGVQFYSLQKGDAAAEARRRPDGLALLDLSDALHDFADTAAAIANMDLIISVDTSVAHVAGALGKPVWTLLPYLADWRWGVDRADSPWYPTMRLFRQLKLGEWSDVMERVAGALKTH
jgi:tetratricopeptide (TPR) repeat protein